VPWLSLLCSRFMPGGVLRAAFNRSGRIRAHAGARRKRMVLCQSLINFAWVLGWMPTKGIPLPFVSYGGSSLLAMLLATGVLLNVAQQAGSRTMVEA